MFDRILDDARVLRKARMLPPKGPLTPEHIAQVRQLLDQFITDTKLSHDALSKKLGRGFSPSLLGKFRDGSYEGDIDKVARAINTFIENEWRSMELQRDGGFVETEVAKRMLGIVRTCYIHKFCGVIQGPAGIGKSMVISVIPRLFPGAICMRVLTSARGGSGVVTTLLEAAAVRDRLGYHRGLRRLISTLKGTGRLIVVDEAHKMLDQGMDILRDLHDETGCPIVFFGTRSFYERVDDFASNFGQWTSRIGARLDATDQAMRERDPKPLYSPDEIEQIFQSSQLRLDAGAIEYLTDLANMPGLGSLRLARRLVEIAAQLAQQQPDFKGDARTLKQIFNSLHNNEHARIVSERTQVMRSRRTA